MINLYSSIQKYVHNSVSNYSSSDVSDICSKVLAEIEKSLDTNLIEYQDGMYLDTTLDIYKFLSDSQSNIHKVIHHNCQVLAMFCTLMDANKVLIEDISPTMFYLSKFLGQDKIDYINSIELYFLEKIWDLDTGPSKCIKRQSTAGDFVDSLYDIIFLNFIMDANNIEYIEKYYKILRPGGAVILSYSNPLSSVSGKSYEYYYDNLHRQMSELDNVRLFHLTESCSYTIITKGKHHA